MDLPCGQRLKDFFHACLFWAVDVGKKENWDEGWGGMGESRIDYSIARGRTNPEQVGLGA
jgi:hypothetical protein